ncbi:MAG TPA: hypothetical protein VF799_08360 [Geobacteraceae bacterium]
MKRIIAITAHILALALAASSAFAAPPWSANQGNTPGWQLMTPEERVEHQAKLRSFTDYNSCKEYVEVHRKKMVERAKEKGVAAPAMRRNPCDMMKARGLLK